MDVSRRGLTFEIREEELSANIPQVELQGTVKRVERRESGSPRNAFVVDRDLPDSGRLVGQSFHVTWGNGWVWVYRIEAIVGKHVFVSDEPGINYSGNTIDMQYFPIQEYLGGVGFPGPVRFNIPNVSLPAATTPESGLPVSAPESKTTPALDQPAPIRAR